MPNAVAMALELWAESRERAITDVSTRATALAREGRQEDAAFFGFVARLLTIRALHERAQAAATRATSSNVLVSADQPAV